MKEGSDKEMNKNKKGIGIIPTTIITFKESIESIEMSKQRKSHYEKQNINFDYPIIINNKLNFYELKMNLKKDSDKE